MHNNNRKGRSSTISKALLTAGLLGIVGYGNAANAASKFFIIKELTSLMKHSSLILKQMTLWQHL
jgi:hypothetical protein